ncbi:hypothetical protein DFA_04337 [Cavenderia fasciculata]|uniref:F-box domain-containing protein n=1 Tax=Cavenderia fasciculata TaxID=261658 RepID=F4PPA6_CACFS|nr:uncharacterized protein DFA_04337 [Cavenderia fasciculata]EGG22219.1 hypothetical protein DFA_04337 [Cavenderia fasciculata]|eukprot:XP_004360070.1 hypothetical protein DFA_04337 [Cavenderia fasciculata]
MSGIESIIIIIDIILNSVGGDRYLLSFPYMLVCKKWYQIFQSDEFWRSLCLARWTSLSLLKDDYQITIDGSNIDKDRLGKVTCYFDPVNGSEFKFPVFKVKCWKDLFKSRFNRTLHLRYINNRYITQYLNYVEELESKLVYPVGMVKKMEPLDELVLDGYRRINDVESLFLLESVVYDSISEMNGYEKHGYIHNLATSGSFMSLCGKKATMKKQL